MAGIAVASGAVDSGAGNFGTVVVLEIKMSSVIISGDGIWEEVRPR